MNQTNWLINFTSIVNNNSINLTISNSNGNQLQDVMTLMNKIYPLPLCIMGTVGNLFIFIIYSQATTLHKVSTSFYIRLQTISDTLLIYFGILRYFILGVFSINIKDSSSFMCRTLNYTIFVLNFTAAWLLVVSSIDRLVFVFNFSRFNFILKRPVQIVIAALLPVLGLTIFIWHPFSYGFALDPVTLKHTCNELDLSYKRVLYLLELVFTVLIPFVLLSLTSLYLGIGLKRSKDKFKKKPDPPDKKCSLETAANSNVNIKESLKRLKSSFSFTMTLLTLNFFFLILLVPHTLINIYKTYMNINTTQINFYYTLATIIRYSFFSMSFFAHFFSNRRFREYFFCMVSCGRSKQSKV